MTESPIKLLLRLSEAGEPAILWGRQAKPYLGRDFERLIDSGVLIEDAPATEWDVCASCECGHGSRSIQEIDGRFIAACPADRHSDTMLDAQDLRSFRITMLALVREIAVASGIQQEPTQVMPGVWHLGTAPAKRALFLAFTHEGILAPGLLLNLKMMDGKLPITIIAPALPVAELLRFTEAEVHYVVIGDAFSSDGTTFALDAGKLMPPSSIAAKLTLIRSQSKLIFEGRELELAPISFQLLWCLAEAVVRGDGMVSRLQIEKCLWPTTVSRTAAADAVRNLRDALKKIDSKGKIARSLIRTLNTQGYILNLDAADIRLID